MRKLYIVKESAVRSNARDTQQFYATMLEVEDDQKELIDAVQDAAQKLSTSLGEVAGFLQTKQKEEGEARLNETLAGIRDLLSKFFPVPEGKPEKASRAK